MFNIHTWDGGGVEKGMEQKYMYLCTTTATTYSSKMNIKIYIDFLVLTIYENKIK